MEGNILIVDDYPVVQMGIRAFIDRYKLFSRTDIAGSGKEAVELIKKHKGEDYYQMAIVDINLPDYEALSLVKFIKDHSPNTPILMFSMEPPRLYMKRLINLGVKGFLNKTSPDDELLFAIKSIKAGRCYFASEIMTEIVCNADSDDEFQCISKDLSGRESEILSLMIRGKSHSEICELLKLHKSSVATYRTRIFKKIGIRTNFELYQWASIQGLIKP